ncbi:DUF3592 domain-containing protein [Marinobacter sp. KMM 10035]|uniref:DUF3592 domain-containing protein n=1 Tax=Marinobacter sp. KMM 10035 TaxID=3134034 RepID=UPI0039790F00
MNASPRAALTRIFVLLLFVCTLSFVWETSKHFESQPTIGHVTAHQYRDYTISYSVQGQTHQFATRRGILDFLGRLKSLQTGDEVPLLVNPKPPYEAVIDTLNGRYQITITFVALTLVFAATAMVSGLRRQNAQDS